MVGQFTYKRSKRMLPVVMALATVLGVLPMLVRPTHPPTHPPTHSLPSNSYLPTHPPNSIPPLSNSYLFTHPPTHRS